MKTKLFTFLAGVALISFVAGCVGTVSGTKTAGVPLIRDRVEGRYERSLDQVFTAAKEVVQFNGTMISENILHDQTNRVKAVEGRVNQRSVFVRVEELDPKVTAVTVQTRTRGGGTDVDLAHEIEKQIALRLVAR